MKISTAAIFRPSSIAVVGGCMSAVVWAMPTFGVVSTGYLHPSNITMQAVALIFLWYFVIWCSLRIGEMVGSSYIIATRSLHRVSLESTRILATFTGLAATGIFSTYYKVLSSLGLEGAIAYIALSQANALKNSLYDDYSAGIVSLRYLVAFSVSMSIYRYTKSKKVDLWMIANILLLAMSALLSSRLIFVASMAITAFLTKRWQPFLTINIFRLLIGVGAAFTVLALLNFSRNGNYYANDGFGFWGAGLSSIVTYVGSPFQVMLKAADEPTFLANHGEDSARIIADIDSTLNTNSSFVQLHEAFGFGAWPYIIVICVLMGFIFGACSRHGRTAFLLPCGAILYGAAELWRLELYSQGIFMVWLIMGLLVPAAFSFIPKIKVPRLFPRVRLPRIVGLRTIDRQAIGSGALKFFFNNKAPRL